MCPLLFSLAVLQDLPLGLLCLGIADVYPGKNDRRRNVRSSSTHAGDNYKQEFFSSTEVITSNLFLLVQ